MRSGMLLVGLALCFGTRCWADERPATQPAGRKLVVGTRHVPPFAVKNADGTWSGVTIDLWRDVAAKLNRPYEFQERDLKGLLAGVQDKSLDVVAAGLTVTADRERDFDFTHPFHTSGLGIAVVPRGKAGWLGVVQRFFSWTFLKVVMVLVTALFVVGLVVWAVERRRNPQHFGGGVLKGIGAGLWWSAVTMTAVGYGDKAPVSWAGRLAAILWMFTAIVLISIFTASVTASLTVGHLESKVQGPDDLFRVRVATVEGSASAAYLRERHISCAEYDDIPDAVEALAAGEVDAVVYDAPVLRYLVQSKFPAKLAVLPNRFDRQDYAFALPEGSSLREPLNRAIIEDIRKPSWKDTLFRYLGE